MIVNFKGSWPILLIGVLLVVGAFYFSNLTSFFNPGRSYEKTIDSLQTNYQNTQKKIESLKRINKQLLEQKQSILDCLYVQKKKTDSLKKVENQLNYDRQSNKTYLNSNVVKLDSFWSTTKFYIKGK